MNNTNESNTETNNLFQIQIGPGYDRERALKAIDTTLARIDRVLADMEAQDKRESTSRAFERFMVNLSPSLRGMDSLVKIENNVSWIKVQSLVNGHKVYISKGKLAVGRVDSTLPPDLLPGALHPTRYNGRIASWLPADVKVVARAIMLLGSEQVTPIKLKKKRQ